MSWEDGFTPVDEQARLSFEAAVRSGQEPELTSYLPAPDSKLYMGTLEELVMIEMEHRWSTSNNESQGPLIEDYLRQFPALKSSASLGRLIEEEVYVRVRHDKAPPIEEYQQRFPDIDLSDTFQELVLDTFAEEEVESGSSSTALSPGRRYENLQVHASGGMGIVYRAKDQQIGREVALKHLQFAAREDDPSYARFINEAKLAGTLEHPGIVPVYEIGESEDGSPFYAMKLVEGKTLDSLIRDHHTDNSTISLRELLSVLTSVAKTIAFAHDRGVIHRDIKPANIIVGSFGETVILDWGLAKQLDGIANDEQQRGPLNQDMHQTQMGTILGTPAYMSPEQAQGLPGVDTRADIYALGAVLYHVLAGQPSVTQQEDFEQLRQAKRRPRPSRIKSGIPKPLEAICLRAMAVDADERYASALEFAGELEHYLADEPVSAFSDPWSTRLWRWSRKHKTAVAATLALVLTSTVAAVVVAFEQQKSFDERRRQIATTEAVIDGSESTALGEIQAGRFANGVIYLKKAIETAKQDAAFAERTRLLQTQLAEAEKLTRFYELVDRAELLAWEEYDDDMIVLLQNALALVHVFEHRDWWNHLTDFTLDPRIEDELRTRVYRELGMLVGIQLKKVAYEIGSADVLLAGGNERSQAEFEKVSTPLAAAMRFRPAVGLEFAKAWQDQQARPNLLTNARLVSAATAVLDHRSLRNPTDRFFVGLCLVFYAQTQADGDAENHAIVALTQATNKMLQSVINFDLSEDAALGHLRVAAAEEPTQFWTRFTQGWAAERAGLYGEAVAAYTGCLAQNPDESRAYLHRAFQYWRMSVETEDARDKKLHLHRALQDLQRGIHQTPGFADFHWRSADYLAWYHSPEMSLVSLRRGLDALKLEAPQPELLHTDFTRHWREIYIRRFVTSYLDPWLAENPDWGEALLAKALAHLRLGETENAREALAKAAQNGTSSLPLHAIVRGELALLDQDLETATTEFSRAIAIDETDFLAHRGLALANRDQRSAGENLELFLTLRERTKNEWQAAEALSYCVLYAARIGADDQAVASLREILEIRPSDPCEFIVTNVTAKDFPALRDRLIRLLENRFVPPTEPLPQNGEQAGLLNGGFELSLDRYWHSDSTHPFVWWNEKQCHSRAVTTVDEKHSGLSSLRIQHFSERAAGKMGHMRQTFPTKKGQQYRLRAWVKSQNVTAEAVEIRIGAEGQAADLTLKVAAGTQDWHPLEGTYVARSGSSELEVVSVDRGIVWLDDLTVELVLDEE